MDLNDVKWNLSIILAFYEQLRPTFSDLPVNRLQLQVAEHATRQLFDGIDAPDWDNPARVRFVSAAGGPFYSNPKG